MLKRLVVVFLMVLAFSQVAFCQDDLLNFLIEQNEAAREKVKTAEYKVKWTSDLETTKGFRNNKGFGEVKIKGDLRFSTQECDVSIPATGWQQKHTQRMVINDKYLAYWPSFGNGYIYRDDHQSLEKLSDDSKLNRVLHTTPDMFALDIAFGGEKGTNFKEMMKLHPDEITWTAEESRQSNGRTVYLIEKFSPFMNDSTKPAAVWTIDPEKGFLVTQAVFYSKAGNIWITRKIEPREIGNGIWFPASYQENRYGKPTDPEVIEKSDHNTAIQLEDIKVNNVISNDFFVIESILPKEYRESTTLFRKGLDGSSEAYVYRNGGYLLREIWHSLEHVMATTEKDLYDNTDSTERQRTARGKQPHVINNNQVISEKAQITSDLSEETANPLIPDQNDNRLVYFLLGLIGFLILAFFYRFAKSRLKQGK